MHTDVTFTRLENNFGLKLQPNALENYFFNDYGKTIKESSTMLCSDVKHLGSKSIQEVRKNTRLLLVFSLTLVLCSTVSCLLYNRTEQSRGFNIC